MIINYGPCAVMKSGIVYPEARVIVAQQTSSQYTRILVGDGYNYLNINLNNTIQIVGTFYGNGYWVIVAYSGTTGLIFYSTDGYNWVFLNLPISVYNASIVSCYDRTYNEFVVALQTGSSSGKCYYFHGSTPSALVSTYSEIGNMTPTSIAKDGNNIVLLSLNTSSTIYNSFDNASSWSTGTMLASSSKRYVEVWPNARFVGCTYISSNSMYYRDQTSTNFTTISPS